VVRVVGHEGKVICEQHVGHQKTWSTSECAFYPVCNAINVVQVDGKQQRGEEKSLFNAERWLHRSCLVPIQRCTFGNCVNGPTVCFLEYNCKPVWRNAAYVYNRDDPLCIFCAACKDLNITALAGLQKLQKEGMNPHASTNEALTPLIIVISAKTNC